MEKETARIEAFSDAVFAIAVTLLVLELHVPEFSKSQDPGLLMAELKAQWPGYLAFTISFFSIFIMWVNHHKLFKQIYKRNTGLMFANGLILFLASIVSYPSALLARFYQTPSQQFAVSVYTGMFVLVNISYSLLWYQATRNKELLRPGLEEHTITLIRNNYLYGLFTYLSAFILSFYFPSTALIICVLLWGFWAVSSGKISSRG
ncbi:TMEM175 family protein [Pedobacter sp. NJ-S-72]